MTKIDFYITSDPNNSDNYLTACHYIEKFYQQQRKIYIHTTTEANAKKLDTLLWTFKDDSFIPHQLHQQDSPPSPPIQIGFDKTPEDHRDILINLSHDVPSFYSQFLLVLEIVSGDPQHQAKARERYRFYRDQTCEVTTYKI